MKNEWGKKDKEREREKSSTKGRQKLFDKKENLPEHHKRNNIKSTSFHSAKPGFLFLNHQHNMRAVFDNQTACVGQFKSGIVS